MSRPVEAAGLVSAYAADFLGNVPDGHAVTSPLGAWLLRALAAGPPDDAAAAAALLEHPHALVRASLALWTAPDVETDRLGVWRSRLPGAQTGPIPSQAQADAWAADATDGMVPRFPLALDPLTVLVLANALATRVTWPSPFVVVDAGELGPGFGSTLGRALSSAYRTGQRALLADTSAGMVGVLVSDAVPADDGAGLSVVSVVGAADVPPARVHAAAMEVAALVTGRGGDAAIADAFDAPLTGHCWTIEEGVTRTFGGEDRVVRARALLPAWSARTDLDLLPGDGTAFGLDAAVAALQALLPEAGGPYPAAARQSAYAAFSRTGFEAAAVTAIGLARAAMPGESREVPSRTLTVRFDRPFAACAVATGGGPWHGVPVFHAWVTRPEEPADD